MPARKLSDAGLPDLSLCDEWTSHVVVCTRLSLFSTTKYMNALYWNRTHGMWGVKDKDFPTGEKNPHPCPKYRGRRHVLYYC